jgi:hypothetical protein
MASTLPHNSLHDFHLSETVEQKFHIYSPHKIWGILLCPPERSSTQVFRYLTEYAECMHKAKIICSSRCDFGEYFFIIYLGCKYVGSHASYFLRRLFDESEVGSSIWAARRKEPQSMKQRNGTSLLLTQHFEKKHTADLSHIPTRGLYSP